MTVSPGDAVVIRTGRWARRAELGPWDIANEAAGLHASSRKPNTRIGIKAKMVRNDKAALIAITLFSQRRRAQERHNWI